jgi:hypothetical protein
MGGGSLLGEVEITYIKASRKKGKHQKIQEHSYKGEY